METDIKNFNLGAIDVGSNASRLLIKNVGEDMDGNLKMRKLLFLRIPLRLGMEVFKNGKISDSKEEEFLRTMKAYRLLMKVFHVTAHRACCTSAMRDAKNGKDVLKNINKETDLGLEIISGDEESQIIYDSHLELFQNNGNYLYVDVGGGSTETTFISDGKRIFSHSYNIGTIRMLDGAVKESEFHEMRSQLGMVTKEYSDIQIIGSGGNIGKLYRIADKREKQVEKLPVDTLRKLYSRLEKMSLEERMDVYNMKPDRADVIVPAAEIFLSVAESIRATMILVPNLGLVDGLINDLAKDIIKDSKKN
jgi:exopolyphosphatase/guanosine-5'-triphosphate,3'-diphosphate pyrophosphatase